MEYFNLILFAVSVVISTTNTVNAGTFNDSDSLYKFLTSGRNKNLRPHTDTSKATEVYIDFFLINLQEINAVDGTVSLAGYFQIMWKDPNMVWDGTQYGNIYYMQLPEDTIWKPPLINSNSANEMKFLGIDGLLATVVYDGSISWYPGQNLKFTCNIDTTYFPFDKQECTLSVLAWGYSGYDITINSTFQTVQTTTYTDNSEWELTSSRASAINSLTMSGMALFTLTFTRRPLFLLATLLLPAILLALLNIVVFLLPQESGERIGFCITLLLAVVVYLTIAQGLLPATAEPRLSSICIILMIDLMMSGMILVSVIISCRIYYKPELSIPKWTRKLVYLERKCCSRPNKVADEPSMSISPLTEKENLDSKEKPEVEEEEVAWPDVARVWDKLNMIAYLIMFVAGNIAYFLDIYIGTLK